MALRDSVVGLLRSARDAISNTLDWYFNDDTERNFTIETEVNRIRRIPLDDKDKKRALARFFQSPDGAKYTRREREQAYNDLLGRERNSRQIG